LSDRYYWGDVLTELRNSLIKVETAMNAQLHSSTGIWIDQFITAEPRADESGIPGTPATGAQSEMDQQAQQALARRYGLRGQYGARVAETPPTAAPAADAAQPAADGTTTPRKRSPASRSLSARLVSTRSITALTRSSIMASCRNCRAIPCSTRMRPRAIRTSAAKNR
jgi:hypothetical protein